MENPCHWDNLHRPLPQWHIQFLVLMDPAWESRRNTWPLQRPWKTGVTFILKGGSGISPWSFGLIPKYCHLVKAPCYLGDVKRLFFPSWWVWSRGRQCQGSNAFLFASLIPSVTLPLTSKVNLSHTTLSLLEPPSQTIWRGVSHQPLRWF